MANKFIREVLLPYFETFKNTQMGISLYDLETRIIFATQDTADKLDVSMSYILRLSYKNVTAEQIRKICEIENTSEVNAILKASKQIVKLHEIAIKNKTIVSYIDFTPFKNYYHAYSIDLIPLSDYDGNVVAVQGISTRFYFFGILDYLNALNNKHKARSLSAKPTIHSISSRQHEVLFLLSSGMSQNEIALFLGIQRGSISRLVSRLCEKFDIAGINIELLLKRSKKLRLHESIPKSLSLPRIIILDPEVKAALSIN